MHFLGRNEEIYERNFETIPDNELGYYRNSRGKFKNNKTKRCINRVIVIQVHQ